MPSAKSLGEPTTGSYDTTWRFSLGKATRDYTFKTTNKQKQRVRKDLVKSMSHQILSFTFHMTMSFPFKHSCGNVNKIKTITQRVRRSSASGSSVASFRFSKLILSLGLWFQANSTANWNVVTSKSYCPTSFLNVIWGQKRWNQSWSVPLTQQTPKKCQSQGRISSVAIILRFKRINKSLQQHNSQ